MGVAVELTLFSKDGGPLTKEVTLAADGTVSSDGSACFMQSGAAKRVCLANGELFSGLAELINSTTSEQALGTGTLVAEGDTVMVCTRKRPSSGAVARTRDAFDYRPGEPAFVLLDFDRKGMPAAVKQRLDDLGGFWSGLQFVFPALAAAGTVQRASTSSGLIRTADGHRFPDSGGVHVYLALRDGSDAKRFLEVLHQRCWLAGLGWFWVSASGTPLERSVVDTSVWAPERLIFEGAPTLGYGLAQDAEVRRAVHLDGDIVDSKQLADLAPAEAVEYRRLLADAKAAAEPEARRVRTVYKGREVDRLVARGVSAKAATRIIDNRLVGDLTGADVLEFDDSEIGVVTVAEVLADPDRFDGETLADPVEGVVYGRCKAKVFAASSRVAINSFAHGGVYYRLWHDAASAGATLDGAGTDAASALEAMAGTLKLSPVEREALIKRAARQSGVGVRAMTATLKAAEEAASSADVADLDDQAHAAGKPVIRVRAGGALAAVKAADEALAAQTPPIAFERGGALVRMAKSGIDSDHRIVAMSDADLSLRLAEAATWVQPSREDGERTIDPPPDIVRKLASNVGHWSVPPLVGITDVPVLRLETGEIHGSTGYDPVSGLFYSGSAPPLEVPAQPSRGDAVAAMERVLAPFSEFVFADAEVGRSVLAAYVLTGAIRQVIDLAPGLIVSAHKRGSGKTLAVRAANALLYGRAPSMVAPEKDFSEAEQRKQLTAQLLRGTTSLCLDNLLAPVGGGPLDAMMTMTSWDDRVLGESTMAGGLPTRVLMAATGNNLAARADAARRWLRVVIDSGLERPEDQHFGIVDLVGYVMQHRQRLLADVFTVLRAFILAGKPNPCALTLGSYETWASVVPACLVWLGMADPLASQLDLAADDGQRSELRAFLAAWHGVLGDEWVLVRDLEDRVSEAASFKWHAAYADADAQAEAADTEKVSAARHLRGVLAELTRGKIGGAASRMISAYLGNHRREIVDGLRLEQRENAHLKVAEWRVARV
ncbi:hypothetical protein WV31_05440 [Magnetospirillum sp. ME-1]|uniref:hypothetical protein n=1 Tax=Magnetospirillum sp. ME-1 TaxID=1639348 RepID=UPI000A17CD04|nr:hypothetical protein [Magnetospirillum sp. ME-1]ARJ65141.1 hypothetical protein WV31_05440 [Magnetospirillum sp. ME-1]